MCDFLQEITGIHLLKNGGDNLYPNLPGSDDKPWLNEDGNPCPLPDFNAKVSAPKHQRLFHLVAKAAMQEIKFSYNFLKRAESLSKSVRKSTQTS